MNDSITKNSLAKSVLYHTGLPISISEEIINQIFESIIHYTALDGIVKITNFGSFKTKQKKARPGRDINNKRVVEIHSRKVVSFQISEKLKQEINNG